MLQIFSASTRSRDAALRRITIRLCYAVALLGFACGVAFAAAPAPAAQPLLAGVGRVDITDRAAGPVNDPAFVRALVLRSGDTTAVVVTVDAVAIGGIGRIPDTFLGRVRAQLQADLGIPPAHVIVNASHCHATVRTDVHELAVQAVKEAARTLAPVRAGAGAGHEDRISENRRLKLKDGSEADMRRAYPMPPDRDIAAVGPIDPQIGILRIDRLDGRPLAVVSVFACHPIMNPPSKGSSADFPGFAANAIEAALGDGGMGDGMMAFFVQGCGGDMNPIRYKETGRPADAEPLGVMFAASVLAAARRIDTRPDAPLAVTSDTIRLPRAADYESRIARIEAARQSLVDTLRPVSVNFKAFLPLAIEQGLSPDRPSHAAQAYLHDESLKRTPLNQLDADNRKLVADYLHNVESMERLVRLNANLALLRKNLALTKAAGSDTLDAEVCGLRVGDFRLVTFPGELSAEVGMAIKQAGGQPTSFVAGYTNGYIYYMPTEAQRRNTGYAQEDCDTLVAPGWQAIFEAKALAVLRGL
jgi:hypothetical protein